MAHRTVIDDNEIALTHFNPETGEQGRLVRFPLVKGTGVQPSFADLFATIVNINDEGRDTQRFASTVTLADTTIGAGVEQMDEDGSRGRFHFATVETRYKRQITLNQQKRKMRDAVAGVTPGYGIVYNNRVYINLNSDVVRYDEGTGFSATLHSFAGGAVPTSEPLVWSNLLIWFLGSGGITYYDGATWTNIAEPATAGVVVGDILYIVRPGGEVLLEDTSPPVLAGFTAVASVNDTPVDMVTYLAANGEFIPFVVGHNHLYEVDREAGITRPAGPQFHPNSQPLRASVMSADNRLYIAQGPSVVAWDGENGSPVGIDRDDGFPVEYTGNIVRLVNGNTSLFALVQGNAAMTSAPELDLYAAEEYRDVLAGTSTAYSMLLSWEGSGWHCRAMSDAEGTGASMMFLSDAEDTYRLWFSWDGAVYAMDLQRGFFNPLNWPDVKFEKSGFILYPEITLSHYETPKIALQVQCGTERCTTGEVVRLYIRYDDSGTWHPLYNRDGTHGITTNGRHSFDLHASPIPMTTSPLKFHDEPAVGYRCDRLQIKAELERGNEAIYSPAINWITVHISRSNPVARAWTMQIDLSSGHKGNTPLMLMEALQDFLEYNASGLLQFSYRNYRDDGHDPHSVYAVRITGLQMRENTGEVGSARATARLAVTQIISKEV